MKSTTVKDGDDGAKLDAVVGRSFEGMSRRLARQAILQGAVKLNGKVVKIFARSVKAGDTLTLDTAPLAAPQQDARADVPILYQDGDIVVVDKPARLLSERVPGENGAAISDVLKQQGLGHTTLVHRLDAGTSGVMVLARTPAATEGMNDAFRDGKVEKSYLLLCVGAPGQGAYDQPLGRDPEHPRRFAPRKEGKAALTRYRTLKEKGGFALANARPETGRTHQIRVHFAAGGHVLLGDRMYDGPNKARAEDGQVVLFDRPLLHAWALAFSHPLSGKAMRFLAPLHPDMQLAASKLGLGTDFDAEDPLW